jgi:predicted dinucleotide-binding enzyme
MAARRTNPRLAGITLHPGLSVTHELSCVRDSDLVVFATPSFAIRQTAALVRPYLREDAVLVSVTKGIEAETGLRMTEILAQETGHTVAALSGPSHAEEVSRGIPTGCVAACEDVAAAELVTTGEVADVIGDKDAAAQLIAALKQKMVEEDMDEDQLSVAVDQVSDQLGVALDQERKEQVIELLLRIKNTDIDVDQLASQAGDLYKKVSGLVEGMNIQPRQAAGFLEKLMDIVFGLLKSFKG